MSSTVQRKRRNRLSLLALSAIVIYIMVGSVLYLLQEKMLFRPTVLPQDYVYAFEHPFEELFLETEPGVRINALHFRSDKPKGVILYFHGNAGNLARWGEITGYFIDMGYDLLMMDYRGYGKSTGPVSEEGLYHDGQHCYNYLLQRYSESEIIIYGRSLGGAVATYVAANNSAAKLVLESPFHSLADVAQARFPIFPVKSLLKYELPNHVNLNSVSCPVTIYHGTDDYIVPFKSGQRLFFESRNGKTDLIPIEGGGHNDLVTFEAYREHLEQLLK